MEQPSIEFRSVLKVCDNCTELRLTYWQQHLIVHWILTELKNQNYFHLYYMVRLSLYHICIFLVKAGTSDIVSAKIISQTYIKIIHI
jgi:hypothetical protein